MPRPASQRRCGSSSAIALTGAVIRSASRRARSRGHRRRDRDPRRRRRRGDRIPRRTRTAGTRGGRRPVHQRAAGALDAGDGRRQGGAQGRRERSRSRRSPRASTPGRDAHPVGDPGHRRGGSRGRRRSARCSTSGAVIEARGTARPGMPGDRAVLQFRASRGVDGRGRARRRPRRDLSPAPGTRGVDPGPPRTRRRSHPRSRGGRHLRGRRSSSTRR